MCNYYRQFVPNFAKCAVPLTDLLKKENKFEWCNKQKDAFEELKKQLVDFVVLNQPVLDQNFELRTDASGVGCGAVLVQNGKPVAFASKRFSEADTKKCTTERELLAVIWAVNKFHHFLAAKEFVLKTDHEAIKWLRNKHNITGKYFRMLNQLEQYKFTVEHTPGKHLVDADTLSRHFATNRIADNSNEWLDDNYKWFIEHHISPLTPKNPEQ